MHYGIKTTNQSTKTIDCDRVRGGTFLKKIAILTSGGDAPGMNAAIRSVTRTAVNKGIQVYGVSYGFKGLVEGIIQEFDRFSVSEKIDKGGTFLRSARYPEFLDIEVQKIAAQQLKNHGITSLVVLGGDGSFKGAEAISKFGIQVIGIPCTIDNDLNYTDYSIGFDTAVNTVVEAIDKLRDTSSSHQRCNIVEVMGRNCGDIAIHSAIATGAKYLASPETGYSRDEMVRDVKDQFARGIRYSIIVMTEHLDNPYELAKFMQKEIGIETRATILGHVQRGGAPSAFDRHLAISMGRLAAELIAENVTNHIVGIQRGELVHLPITEGLAAPVKDRQRDIDTFHLTK
jgi:6-phosphofructokinase 1